MHSEPAAVPARVGRDSEAGARQSRPETRDPSPGIDLRLAESARAGWVNINEGTNYWESHLPFGGRAGSQSGLGRVGGRFSIDRLT